MKDFEKTIGSYTFKKSKKKLKKYSAYKNGKFITNFGAIKPNGVPYQQYFDKIGLYQKYNHNSSKRRALYRLRHNKDYGKESADWFSKKFLW